MTTTHQMHDNLGCSAWHKSLAALMKGLLIRNLHMFDPPVKCPDLHPVNFRSSVEFRSLQETSIISAKRGLLIATRVTKATSIM